MKSAVCFGILFLLVGCSSGDEGSRDEFVLEGKTISAWFKDYRDGEPDQREAARKVLDSIGPQDRKAIPALSRAARDDNPVVRLAAVVALSKINHPDVGPSLVKAMNDRDPTVSRTAIRAYGQLERSLSPMSPPSPMPPAGPKP